MPTSDYSAIQRQILLTLARDSISHLVNLGSAPEVDESAFVPILRYPRACFVTLDVDGVVCGCAGSLYSEDSLIENIKQNAMRAAMDDTDSPPISAADLPVLGIEIAILSSLEILFCKNPQQLIEQLRPGIDGLVIEDSALADSEGESLKATFLPSAWENLRDPETFVSELFLSAGLPKDHWSPTLTVKRYNTQVIKQTGKPSEQNKENSLFSF